MRKRLATAIAGTLLAVGLTLPAQAETLEWTAGQLGGGWYSMAGGLANIIMEENPGLTIKVVPGGGKDNPNKLEAGLSQIGWGLGFLAHAAMQGADPYPNPHGKLRTIGSGWSPSPFHFVRAKDQAMDVKQALLTKGVRIAVTKAGSSEELTFQRVMKYLDGFVMYGQRPSRLHDEPYWSVLNNPDRGSAHDGYYDDRV